MRNETAVVDVAAGEHGELLQRWAAGSTVDWDALYGEIKPRRIALPGYPFARERYWHSADSVGSATAASVPCEGRGLRVRGRYVITGDSAAASSVARHLARVYSAKLTLVGAAEPGEQQEALLRELRELGGEAVYERGAQQRHDGVDGVIQVTAEWSEGDTPEELDRKLQQRLENTRENEVTAVPVRSEVLRGLTLAQSVEWQLRQELGELLQIALERLSVEENLAQYGADSIALTRYAQRLSQRYGIELLPGVFFAHPTLKSLREHLLSRHGAVLERYYADSRSAHAVSVPAAATAPSAPSSSSLLSAATGSEEPELIAIVGMSARVGTARDIEALWELLKAGGSAVSEIPSERFDWREYYEESDDSAEHASGKIHSKWLGAIAGVDEFDALFFEISPREAQCMDPRQRLLLQESWKALEDAGYGASRLSSERIGVFVGVEQGDYQYVSGGAGGVTANHEAILASRLSYFLNLKGPVLAINTACSSGLVAAHQGCMSVLSGECDTALVGAVSVTLTARSYQGMSEAGMLSRRGRCAAFAQEADGLVPGEAAVAVVLKRLSRAIEAGMRSTG